MLLWVGRRSSVHELALAGFVDFVDRDLKHLHLAFDVEDLVSLVVLWRLRHLGQDLLLKV